MKLYMVILGCTPKGRFTEQHDVFFGIANSLQELKPQMTAFWPDTKLHIDVWREVTQVDGYEINVVPMNGIVDNALSLFFINLGGYKPNEFEEYHYKMIVIAENLEQAVAQSKSTAFYKHHGFKGAPSHVDNKFGVDVDDIYGVIDMIEPKESQRYQLKITKTEITIEDQLHIGYLPFNQF